MSVYKEDIKFLNFLERNQRHIMSGNLGVVNGYYVAGEDNQVANDATAVKQLRKFIEDNKEGGTITQSEGFEKGGNTGWWKFSYEMVEAIEDGRKIGAGVDIVLTNAYGNEYLSVSLRDPK
jgi:hypothetical protein